jgi:hypothetical protein
MAEDSTRRHAGTGDISLETIAVLRDALRGQVALIEPGVRPAGGSPALGAALRRLSTEARARGVRAERVIILLKEVWQSLPEVASLDTEPRERARLLDRIVTWSIEAYYDDA